MTKFKKFPILALAALTLAFSACEKDFVDKPETPATEANTFISEDTESIPAGAYEEQLRQLRQQMADNEKATRSITLVLDNGNTLHFLDTDEEVLVVEAHECPDCSALATLEEAYGGKDYSPLDIFWAYSRPGMAIPAALSRLYGSPDPGMHAIQGWARGEVLIAETDNKLSTRAADLACNNVNFLSSIGGGFIGNPDFIRLDKTPGTYSPFVAVHSNTCLHIACIQTGSHTGEIDDYTSNPWECTRDIRYRYRATFKGVTKWRGKVCGRPIEKAGHSHKRLITSECAPDAIEYMGPVVSFQKRKYDNLSNSFYWVNLKSNSGKTASWELPGNKTYVYTWYVNSSKKNAYRIAIDDAKKDDQFDIMMDK